MRLVAAVGILSRVAIEGSSDPPLCPFGYCRGSSILFSCETANLSSITPHSGPQHTGHVQIRVPARTTVDALRVPQGIDKLKLSDEAAHGIYLETTPDDNESLWVSDSAKPVFHAQGVSDIRPSVSSGPQGHSNLTIKGPLANKLTIHVSNPSNIPLVVTLRYSYTQGVQPSCGSVPDGCVIYDKVATMAMMAAWSLWMRFHFFDKDQAWRRLTQGIDADPGIVVNVVHWSSWTLAWKPWNRSFEKWMASFHFIDALGVQDYWITRGEFNDAYRFSDIYPSIVAFISMIAMYPTASDAWRAMTGNSASVKKLNGLSAERWTVVWHSLPLQAANASAKDVFLYLSEDNHTLITKDDFFALHRSARLPNTRPFNTTAVAILNLRNWTNSTGNETNWTNSTGNVTPCHGRACAKATRFIGFLTLRDFTKNRWAGVFFLSIFISFFIVTFVFAFRQSATDLKQTSRRSQQPSSRDIGVNNRRFTSPVNYEAVTGRTQIHNRPLPLIHEDCEDEAASASTVLDDTAQRCVDDTGCDDFLSSDGEVDPDTDAEHRARLLELEAKDAVDEEEKAFAGFYDRHPRLDEPIAEKRPVAKKTSPPEEDPTLLFKSQNVEDPSKTLLQAAITVHDVDSGEKVQLAEGAVVHKNVAGRKRSSSQKCCNCLRWPCSCTRDPLVLDSPS